MLTDNDPTEKGRLTTPSSSRATVSISGSPLAVSVTSKVTSELFTTGITCMSGKSPVKRNDIQLYTRDKLSEISTLP